MDRKMLTSRIGRGAAAAITVLGLIFSSSACGGAPPTTISDPPGPGASATTTSAAESPTTGAPSSSESAAPKPTETSPPAQTSKPTQSASEQKPSVPRISTVPDGYPNVLRIFETYEKALGDKITVTKSFSSAGGDYYCRLVSEDQPSGCEFVKEPIAPKNPAVCREPGNNTDKINWVYYGTIIKTACTKTSRAANPGVKNAPIGSYLSADTSIKDRLSCIVAEVGVLCLNRAVKQAMLLGKGKLATYASAP